MFSMTRQSRQTGTSRSMTTAGYFAWMSKSIPLLLVLTAFGCGLGDHGNSSETSNSDVDGGGDEGATGAGVSGFESPDAATAVAGSAGLPTSAAMDFCATDSLAGVSETGVRGFDFDAGDMIPLCSGWVVIANQTNERIEIRNVVTGEVDSHYDVPGEPQDLEIDLELKRVYATLPAENLIASIDLLGSDLLVAATNSTPLSMTQTAGELLVAADGGMELRAYEKATLTFIASSDESSGEAVVYNPEDGTVTAASSSMITVFDYMLDAAAGTLTLTSVTDDPSTGDPLALELSPNNESLALVIPGGNASFAGANVINDFEAANADVTLGAWKVDETPTSAGFSPFVAAIDASDYLIASTPDDLVIFDIPRHAEISRSTPASDCDEGSFDQVAFSRGGDLALGKRNCGAQRGTEFHWMAPAAGFGDSASAIGVDVAALATVLPTVESDPLCATDDLSAITTNSSGSLEIPLARDIEPLCDGWVFVSERSTNRVVLLNVITGQTLAEWDLPDLPTELIIDEDNKFLFATLPAGSDVARIDLAGPNLGTLTTTNATTSASPSSITIGPGNTVLVTGFVEPGELVIRSVNALTMTPSGFLPLEVLFRTATSQIAYDRSTDQLFVSDEAGSALFTFTDMLMIDEMTTLPGFGLTDPEDELFDTLNSEIILASPDQMTIALVDQTADLVYDFDMGELADLTDTFWEVGSTNEVTSIAFDSQSTVFGVATIAEMIFFNAGGDHAELANITPDPNCVGDENARVGISRGASLGFYMSNCGFGSARTETIFWNEF